jgi:hypothetical protein
VVRSRGLSHLAVSVAPGTLTDAFRADLLAFYGTHFGWTEIEQLRLPDRMTMAVGRHCYVNVREIADAMTYHGYEHVGLLVASPDDAEAVWRALDACGHEIELTPIDRGDDGYRNFRFRYRLPVAIEVQYLPER